MTNVVVDGSCIEELCYTSVKVCVCVHYMTLYMSLLSLVDIKHVSQSCINGDVLSVYICMSRIMC